MTSLLKKGDVKFGGSVEAFSPAVRKRGLFSMKFVKVVYCPIFKRERVNLKKKKG